MNYILGSGLIAFIAKEILPEYKIIPLGKSRYYQYQVATCDDYILCHKDIDGIIKNIKSNIIPMLIKRSFSFKGQIIKSKDDKLMEEWLNKIYSGQHNPHSEKLIKLESFIYNLSGTDVFKILENKYKTDFKDFILSKNSILSIDLENKAINTKNEKLEYDNIISTIPLDALYKLCGIDKELECKDLHTFVMETDGFDFENSTELLVVDDEIDFHKSIKLSDNIYQFFSIKDIQNIPQYMNMFTSSFDILSATVVRKAIPVGNHELHKEFENYNIISVGSNAQWDDLMDLSSCIRRLVRISNGKYK